MPPRPIPALISQVPHSLSIAQPSPAHPIPSHPIQTQPKTGNPQIHAQKTLPFPSTPFSHPSNLISPSDPLSPKKRRKEEKKKRNERRSKKPPTVDPPNGWVPKSRTFWYRETWVHPTQQSHPFPFRVFENPHPGGEDGSSGD
ncbi:uncharacterized protein EAE98_008699 [Botrytis deweyae]|uniref:Uncharacterized protein n=1 Tax=Botrytis deweyae TaxID=2478750 RepID=A0ABQ7IDV9_9HELO|nr:uncharacterized protein EAE98_008699 [Botrytis deweyae]KAF7921273.1 hypothetical protein EAE98_008699 [Botrytis deweyae]